MDHESAIVPRCLEKRIDAGSQFATAAGRVEAMVGIPHVAHNDRGLASNPGFITLNKLVETVSLGQTLLESHLEGRLGSGF